MHGASRDLYLSPTRLLTLSESARALFHINSPAGCKAAAPPEKLFNRDPARCYLLPPPAPPGHALLLRVFTPVNLMFYIYLFIYLFLTRCSIMPLEEQGPKPAGRAGRCWVPTCIPTLPHFHLWCPAVLTFFYSHSHRELAAADPGGS